MYAQQNYRHLVNLLTFACSFRSQAQFFKLIDFQDPYPVPCSFGTFLINKGQARMLAIWRFMTHNQVNHGLNFYNAICATLIKTLLYPSLKYPDLNQNN